MALSGMSSRSSMVNSQPLPFILAQLIFSRFWFLETFGVKFDPSHRTKSHVRSARKNEKNGILGYPAKSNRVRQKWVKFQRFNFASNFRKIRIFVSEGRLRAHWAEYDTWLNRRTIRILASQNNPPTARKNSNTSFSAKFDPTYKNFLHSRENRTTFFSRENKINRTKTKSRKPGYPHPNPYLTWRPIRRTDSLLDFRKFRLSRPLQVAQICNRLLSTDSQFYYRFIFI